MVDAVLVLFSLRECPNCEAAREFLRARGVAFVERDVREEPGAVRDLAKITGESIVPTIMCGDDVQIGWDEARVTQMLDDPLPPEEEDDLLAVLEAAIEPDAEGPIPAGEASPDAVGDGHGTAVESAEVSQGRPRRRREGTTSAE